jgi:hypothetical protein
MDGPSILRGATDFAKLQFKHKELGASKKPLTLVTDDRKTAILHRQILATHPSDVVGISQFHISSDSYETKTPLYRSGRKKTP